MRKHLSYDECIAAIDRLVQVEGRPELLQLSGGEPTIHPDFFRILEYASNQPIDYIMLNTNGIRLAHDEAFVAQLAEYRNRLEIYLQFDGLTDNILIPLRGEPLAAIKRKAVEMIGKYDLNAMLVVTVQPGVNDHQLGELVRFGVERPWIAGLSIQPATYSGRHVLPETLERRITFPDVVKAIEQQTDGMFVEDDFLPLPCAHPNCHTLTYAYRQSGKITPLSRFIDVKNNLNLLANGITFTRPEARQRVEKYLQDLAGCSEATCMGLGGASEVAAEFFSRVVREELAPRDLFRITITSFLDAYNFDVRRLMKCCIHHILPSGHIIPFCAYNVLYRDGHVPLPVLSTPGLEARV
jgi:7,8-dihydro-6-hydroxymethylpterin dimethyltransferase